MPLKVTDVFVPGAFPQHTYIERAGKGLEPALRDALSTPGMVISLSGPSKSGKTVLVEKVVGRDYLITISGSSVRSPEDVWLHALDWMDVPTSESWSKATRSGESQGIAAKVRAKLPFISAEVSASQGDQRGSEKVVGATRERGGLARVVKEIANSDFVILLDDFHYMDREVQIEVAKLLKEAIRLGVKIVTAAVTHRGDDVVRANPELRGRVHAIDLGYWSQAELHKIAEVGFAALNVGTSQWVTKKFTDESAGSPQLMQSLCLNTCFALGFREGFSTAQEFEVSRSKCDTILQQTSATTDFRSLVDVLDAGPRTRGTERKMYKFADGTRGDVYRVALRALSHDPPRLSFPYEDLLRRSTEVCRGEAPVGSSVVGTCKHMARLANQKFPNNRAIDWDEQKQVLDVPDPYLLFYLRWSGHLREE